MRYIDNFNDFSFITGVFVLIDKHKYTDGTQLRKQLKTARKVAHRCARAFRDTYDKPCGYQDAAGDKAEIAGREYMQLVHAYLALKYGTLTKRLANLLDDTLVEE